MSKQHWIRANFLPSQPLGEDGRAVTGSKEHLQLALEAARESMVLAKNNGILPFAKGQKLALFGLGQVDYIRHGLGAAVVHNVEDITLVDGLREMEKQGKVSLFAPSTAYYEKYLESVQDSTDPAVYGPLLEKATYFYKNAFRKNGLHLEIPVPDELVKEAAAFTDTAIYVLDRNSGEFFDRCLKPGDWYLHENEKATLEALKANFAHVVVCLNICAQVESDWLEDPAVDAVLFMWHPGQMGGQAAAEILTGDVNPSGKFVDTITRRYEDHPTAANFIESDWYVNYDEDIYVGYRYFETIPGAAAKVLYPFGFGLSYTSFDVKATAAGLKDGVITVTAAVKNTGKMAGKEIVQVYYSAPSGKLGKAARCLAAFAKTKELAPGESETLTLSFKENDMASYDDTGLLQKSAWVLEQGTYTVFFGTDVRNAAPCFSYEIKEAFRVVEQCSERCPEIQLTRRMHQDGSYEELPLRLPLDPHYKKFPASAAKAPEKTAVLGDVLEGTVTMDEFLAQMSNLELAFLTGGQACGGICCTSGFAGNEKYGIPVVGTSDAPGGLRIKALSGVKGTSFPTATGLACSWNTDLAYAAAKAIAREIKENNMYAWLGPALNIHRNPLSGRNFEYYSEDPLIAGKFAAASTLGAQSERISASPKHFAANDKDFNRRESDSRMTERALREIYLKGFEICVKESDPKTVMSSYNRVNGVWACQCEDLLTYILRDEWGFKGLVMTDWSGHGLHAKEILAGSDMKMARGDIDQVMRFVRDKDIDRGALEARVRNLLNLLLWYEGCDTWM